MRTLVEFAKNLACDAIAQGHPEVIAQINACSDVDGIRNVITGFLAESDLTLFNQRILARQNNNACPKCGRT